MDNWKIIDEGTCLLHYWGNNKIRLCDTVRHNIMQLPPLPHSDTDSCTACAVLIETKLNQKKNKQMTPFTQEERTIIAEFVYSEQQDILIINDASNLIEVLANHNLIDNKAEMFKKVEEK